jgi:hypothetical protein
VATSASFGHISVVAGKAVTPAVGEAGAAAVADGDGLAAAGEDPAAPEGGDPAVAPVLAVEGSDADGIQNAVTFGLKLAGVFGWCGKSPTTTLAGGLETRPPASASKGAPAGSTAVLPLSGPAAFTTTTRLEASDPTGLPMRSVFDPIPSAAGVPTEPDPPAAFAVMASDASVWTTAVFPESR